MADMLRADRNNALRGAPAVAAVFLMFPFIKADVGVSLMYLIIAVIVAGSATAWGQWLLYARLWLPLTGRLPWRIPAFLADAYDRGVLRQSGAVYQFRHARLQNYLIRAGAIKV